MANLGNKSFKTTTIKIYRETKSRLDRLKEYNRESYDDILRKIFFILNVSKKNPEKARRALIKIDKVVKTKQKYTERYSYNLEKE